MAEIGTIIDGKYELLKLIGKGGMSKVYLAMDRRLNKQWAVKEIEKNAQDKNNEIVIQSSIDEANMMKRLDHPALPRIVDIINSGDVIFVVMDYIEGEPLSRHLEKYGALPQSLVINWAQDLCDVLAYLHTRTPPIIYRDMKPANIMLRPEGNIKLIDFGIAREYKNHNIADTVNLGTKGYAAPEQFGNQGQTDARTDIYNLGVTIYHLVTGHNPAEPPYELYPIRHWKPELSGGLEKIIQRCTQLNPADRYQSCEELLYALQHYGQYDDSYRKRQKRKLRWFTAAAAAAVLFLGLGAGALHMEEQVTSADYENYILLAQTAATEEDKAQLYLQAIDINPTESTAYLGLVNTYKEDAVFTLEEEQAFKQKLNQNLAQLRETSWYPDFAFETGKLYWHYYDYGRTENADNQLTRMKSAVQWFDDAIKYAPDQSDHTTMATVYRDIGAFNRDIILNIEESADKGRYEPYWHNLQSLVTLVENNPDESDIVRLELYRLVLNSIETYARRFRGDGIQQEDMLAMCDAAEAGLENTEPLTEKTLQMKQDMTGRLPLARKSVGNAYREQPDDANEVSAQKGGKK